MQQGKNYLVLGCKSWNRRTFEDQLCSLPGQWRFIGDPAELSTTFLRDFQPRYLFFLHWSWKVATDIVDSFECVCFHMTDLPFGRGGSPLQNLIVRGYQETKLSALRMSGELDAGPVYMKKTLSLYGIAEEIYVRATLLSAQMIKEIVTHEPKPVPQTGAPVFFSRRKPQESEIPDNLSLPQLHDHLRMLDAEGYPAAFLVYNGHRYEFTRAVLYDGQIEANVKITPISKEPKS